MRIVLFGMLGVALAGAQPPARPQITIVIPSQQHTVVIPSQEQVRPPYLIAFSGGAVSQAESYWVSGNMLCYVTPEHQLRTAPLAGVDRALSERLNREQDVAFALPEHGEPANLLLTLAGQLGLQVENGVVRVPDLRFEVGESSLTTEGRERLGRIAALVAVYPTVKVRLSGFADDTGSREYNLRLSERRAQAVRDWLLGQGIPAGTIAAAWYGEASPEAPNSTAEGRRRNRRVEVRVAP